MARHYLKTIFGALVIFIFASPVSCLEGPTLSLEELQEQFQQLRDNHNEMKINWEAKVTQLEEQMKLKDEQHKILADDLARLEIAFQNEIKIDRKVSGKSAIVRTCRELRATDPTLTSGMYWIDPDGQGVGEDPINVYCDMTTGSTSVPHDSELPINVGHCSDPGCYSRAVNYNASQRQMKVLADISAECHQSIKYECNYAPLELNGVSYSWWNDKDGKAQYFWTGSNSSVHTCQCGIDGNCIDPAVNCNCDATLPIPQVDSGVITNTGSGILPITRLNFGRTLLETSSGVHTLGRFECTGQVAITGMPKSCQDLWRMGHSLSGLYSVMGNAMVESVYCDFTMLPSDLGFQTWIGYADIKSAPVYFYVQRGDVTFSQPQIPIPFDVEILNVGGAFSASSGKFTAPVKGKYFFSFIGIPLLPASSSRRQDLDVGLFMNGGLIAAAHSDEMHSAGTLHETLALQSTLELQKGDHIWLETMAISPGAVLWGNGFVHFSGFILEEEISQSLNI